MPHLAQGVFRVVGHLIEGWLSVEYVRHCDELPESTPARGQRIISIRDDLWIDAVPVALVDIDDRLPNTLLRVTVKEQTEVVHVERYRAA
jgi:hypothetical protein